QQYFKLLLASTDPEILIASLETLSALVKINPSKLHGRGKLIGCGSVNSYLLSLAQGWGSKEEGLGLYSCVVANEITREEGRCLFPHDVENDTNNAQYRIGSSLYFELHGCGAKSSDESSSSSSSSNSRVIHIPDLHLKKEDDLTVLKQCIELYDVPPELRFSLLTRIRYARAFHSSNLRRLYSKICLLAFIVLVQSGDSHDELVAFFANEPEYTNELIRIVRSEETVPGTIRTLAMRALGAQFSAYSSHERRILSGSSISFAGGNRTILLNVLQKAILSLKNSNDPSSLAFVEALLQFYLLHMVSSSASGNNIRSSGMVPTFLPLLEDSDPSHLHLVCLAVKTLQKLMDFSSSAASLFKELGGVEILVERLQTEVHRVIGLSGNNIDSMIIGESSRCNDDQLYNQKRMIKVSLKALGVATYVPTSSSNTLPDILSLIFGNVDKFGGDIYCSAVTLMSEIIHKDPTCYPLLHELGLPDAFLASVAAGILPSPKAITCVPNGIGAICLNARGLEAVKETLALRFLIDIFTKEKYVLVMNEAIVPLANAVEELWRHVSSLRSSGVDIILEVIEKITSLGDKDPAGSSGKLNGNTAMETDSDDKENNSIVTEEVINTEQVVQLCIFHLMVLVHRTMENSETCRIFVENSGIEALLKLLLRPSIAQSANGTIALHSTMVFKGFTQHHSAPLARAFCSSLRDHLKNVLTGFDLVSGSFLLDPRTTPDEKIFSSLFLVEFLLFLADSKDNRWVTALLTEFGNESKNVLEDIGRVHRQILWQIALLEDVKPELEDESTGSVTELQNSEVHTNEIEEQRFNSFRQFLDPLLRRRTSGWSVESQFFDLINLYRDLGRAPSSLQRMGPNGSPLLQFGANNQGRSESSDTIGASNGKEYSQHRTCYASCCDLVRSLSFHSTHLIQELGKVMLLPSRRRDDVVNVSSSSKAVASTLSSLVLDHMNFVGHVNASGSEGSISTKCRYFGKVIDFVDGILLDRPDSCNTVLLNCLYGHGVVSSVLTTFEATSQLLFTINRAPSSPMETDDANLKQDEKADNDHSWIQGPLASYGRLMDHLVTSPFILSSFTKHLLAQPLTSGDVPFPRDAETFVKVLQSMVLKAVLPVWTHPQFIDCSCEFITTVISIIRHIYSGVEVKSVSSNSSARIAGPPPNETAISTIVEMGFSRSRAEEALRQVGSNSVELAMEWLFSHPEEVQEDDELARALALSLGNSELEMKEPVSSEVSKQIEESVQLPCTEELLSTCVRLLRAKETLAFPVRDLLVMICSQNDGQNRSNVMSFLIDSVKGCDKISDSGNSTTLSALFHVIALILNDDTVAREAAYKNGLVTVSSNLLSQWDSGLSFGVKVEVPKWVTAAFLAIDRLLQEEKKFNPEIADQLKRDNVGGDALTIDEDKQNKLQSALGLSPKYIDVGNQKELIEIACSCIKKRLPCETMHAVLQLCSSLTRSHSVAVSFLEAGGLTSLLSLPTTSLFPGFDSIASTIIRHILEDPQTLQQAMESEIRHTLITAMNRYPNGRVTPRNFLLGLNSVISRDPVIFMRAAQSVCQIEMIGERPYVVFLKDREKDKSKEKDREKEKSMEKEKTQNHDVKVPLGNANPATAGNVRSKFHDSRSSRVHKKSSQNFINVIELLLESVYTFIPPMKDDVTVELTSGAQASSDMDIDVAAVKGKGKAIASLSEDDANSQEASLLNLLEVIIDNAESKSHLSDQPTQSTVEQPAAPEVSLSDAEVNGQSSSVSSGVGTSSKLGSYFKMAASAADGEFDIHSILANLPEAELRLLCSLLAREG
ncbi:E3 ubiquitin-protein ligase UPL2-like, partial [Cucurbita pepo subsp. pepo]|uniref:E3 ubiquitin-protein ligase UPL2-like n=1 Tax=Cucurbita pepo subsp. pepo TaxID=3664 RepID=UPI000C9D50C8